jgi:hypothetical protein
MEDSGRVELDVLNLEFVIDFTVVVEKHHLRHTPFPK